MTYIVDTTASIAVVWRFYVVSAHGLRLGTDGLVCERGAVGLLAILILIETAVGHVTSKRHIIVYGIVYRFDAIGIVIRENWVVRSLNVLVDDCIDNEKGVEIEVFTRSGTFCNCLVLVVKISVECWTVVASVALCCK
jgi:hypothetical protein